MDIPAKIESHGPPFPFRLTSIELVRESNNGTHHAIQGVLGSNAS